ncbi:MAG: hypothetical protein KJ923_03450 [Candidatus Omnitrophica bacterium]|nr:hypothetical protein [Candidatus Omnitrophota bacterium]
MKELKIISDIAGMHDLRSIPRTRRSAKPQLPTTAILNLYMARNERDRLVKERMKLAKRKNQIDHRLVEIEQEMEELLEQARKKAAEIRGKGGVPEDVKVEEGKRSSLVRTVLEY